MTDPIGEKTVLRDTRTPQERSYSTAEQRMKQLEERIEGRDLCEAFLFIARVEWRMKAENWNRDVPSYLYPD